MVTNHLVARTTLTRYLYRNRRLSHRPETFKLRYETSARDELLGRAESRLDRSWPRAAGLQSRDSRTHHCLLRTSESPSMKSLRQ